MPYILRRLRPNSHLVFTTEDPAIATILGQHNWKVKRISCEPSQHPEVSTSCLVELPDNELTIDWRFFFGDRVAEQMRDRLQENGFSNPDFRFVGVTTWSRSVNVVQSFFDGALRFDMESLQGDDLKSEDYSKQVLVQKGRSSWK